MNTTVDTATYDAIGQAIEAWRANEAYWQSPEKADKSGNYRLKSTGRIAPWSKAVRNILPPERLARLADQDEGRTRKRYPLDIPAREHLSMVLFAISNAISVASVACIQDYANTYTAPDVYADIKKPLEDLHSRIAEIARDEDLVASLSTLPALQAQRQVAPLVEDAV